MRSIAITGIGGFIGLRMAERALERGWKVSGFDLAQAAVERARGVGVEAEVCDVNDTERVGELFRGVDVVFHTAAVVDESGEREHFFRVNVEGTRSVCKAAQTAGVRQLVHLSSVMVYGFDYPEGVQEDYELRAQTNIYCETKLISEQEALSFHEPCGMEVIVIRPGDVYGAASRPWVLRPLETMKAGLFNLPGGGRGIVNHVYVDNLLDAVFLALEKEVGGEVFNVTDGVATSCLDFFRYHAEMLGGRRVPTLPTYLLKGVLTVATPVYRMRGKEPPATKEALAFLLRHSKVSSEKARKVLGYAPRVSLSEGMGEVEKSLRAGGMLDS